MSRYSFERFLSQSTEKLRREHFRNSLISGAQRRMPMRGISRFSKENLLSHSTEKLRWGTFLFHTKFLESKHFMDKNWGVKEGGVSRYCVKSFLSQSTEKLHRGTLLFFLQNIWYRKNSWIKGAE